MSDETLAATVDRSLAAAELAAAVGAVRTAALRLAAVLRRSDVLAALAWSAPPADEAGALQWAEMRIDASRRVIDAVGGAMFALDDVDDREAGVASNRGAGDGREVDARASAGVAPLGSVRGSVLDAIDCGDDLPPGGKTYPESEVF